MCNMCTRVELITLVSSNIYILSGAERQERSRGLLLCLRERERGEEWDGRFRGQRSEEETRRRHLESRFLSFKICVNAKILSLTIREKNIN